MVKRLLPAIAVAGAILALGTCALFTDSLFPWFLPGVTDTVDLSTWIDDKLVPEDMDENEWGLDLAVLRDDSGTDRVFVAVHGFQTSRLIILESDLSLMAAPNPNPIDGLELSRRALVDANDDYVIGPRLIDNPTLFVDPSFVGGGWDEVGFSIGSSDNYLLWVDNGYSPAMLYCEQWNASWGSSSTLSAAVSGNLEDRWELTSAAFDPQRPAGQQVVLTLRNWANDDEGRIVYASELDLQSAYLADPLTIYPGFSVTPRDGVQRMHYTRKGIVVRQHNDDVTLYRFSEDDSQPLSVGSRHQIIDAYDIDGEYFYIVDKDERMLYKGRTGW